MMIHNCQAADVMAWNPSFFFCVFTFRLAEIESRKENEVRRDEEAFISEELQKMQLESMRMKMHRRRQPQHVSKIKNN